MYEADAHAGGHAHTVRVEGRERAYDVDTGFIVMNDRNYPNFTRLLDQLGVARQPTHMSFSVKGEDEDFEYAGTPRGLYCQPRNLVRPLFQRMVLDLLRFNRELRAMLSHEDTTSVRRAQATGTARSRSGDFLARRRFSRAFVERLIVPQVSAVWSADPRQIALSRCDSSQSSSPTTACSAFATGPTGDRHRRLGTLRRRFGRPFREHLRLSTPVRSITRHADNVELTAEDGRAATTPRASTTSSSPRTPTRRSRC